jgi:hypothetical protein
VNFNANVLRPIYSIVKLQRNAATYLCGTESLLLLRSYPKQFFFETNAKVIGTLGIGKNTFEIQ